MINLRAIIEVLLAIVFTLFVGAGGVKIATTPFKKEALQKVSKGLGSLESFNRQLTD